MSYGFHEATVTGLVIDDDNLLLQFDDVTVTDGSKIRVKLECRSISSLLRDNQPWHSIDDEILDGEVLTLDKDEHSIRMIIEWHDWPNRKTITHSYDVEAASIVMSTVAQNGSRLDDANGS